MSNYKNEIENLFAKLGIDVDKMDETFGVMFPNGVPSKTAKCTKAAANLDRLVIKETNDDIGKTVKVLMAEVPKDKIRMEISRTANGENYVRIIAKENINEAFFHMNREEDFAVPFGNDIDETKIKARLDNGVLTITFPRKARKELVKSINIE